jgi:hypothetical protein
VGEELGLALADLRLLLPRFRYRAVMDDGVTENEMCPVFVARTTDPCRADPDEVDDVAWEPWSAFRAGVLDGTRPVSSWCREQVQELPVGPLGAAEAAYDGLPPAAAGLPPASLPVMELIEIPVPDGTAEAYVAHPPAGEGPGVLFFMDAIGSGRRSPPCATGSRAGATSCSRPTSSTVRAPSTRSAARRT